MPIDLTFYHKRHDERLQESVETAQVMIDNLEKNWCCHDCSITKSITLHDTTRDSVVVCADLIQSVMFSSGYWLSYTVRKKGDDFILAMKVSKMTEEEAVDILMPDDEDDEEDPNGMD